MGAKTAIQWTDRTWNINNGCERVSAGCQNCYAEQMAYRFSGKGLPYEGLVKKVGNEPRWTGKIGFVEKALTQPSKWKIPSRIFVNSMSDLFHKDVSFEYLDKVFWQMFVANHHTYQVLTKRPERMVEYFNSRYADNDKSSGWLWLGKEGSVQLSAMNHIWLGVSVENQEAADKRIPLLLQIPLNVKFLSCEPLLGKVNIARYLAHSIHCIECHPMGSACKCSKVNWVICGGESGNGARPMHPDWAKSLRDQCANKKVDFFFKQWGEYLPYQAEFDNDGFPNWYGQNNTMINGARCDIFDFCNHDKPHALIVKDLVDSNAFYRKVGKHVAGRLLDGQEYNSIPS